MCAMCGRFLTYLGGGFLYILRNGVEVNDAFVLYAVVDVSSCFVCPPSHLHAHVTRKVVG